jgi:hypothetical protein
MCVSRAPSCAFSPLLLAGAGDPVPQPALIAADAVDAREDVVPVMCERAADAEGGPLPEVGDHVPHRLVLRVGTLGREEVPLLARAEGHEHPHPVVDGTARGDLGRVVHLVAVGAAHVAAGLRRAPAPSPAAPRVAAEVGGQPGGHRPVERLRVVGRRGPHAARCPPRRAAAGGSRWRRGRTRSGRSAGGREPGCAPRNGCPSAVRLPSRIEIRTTPDCALPYCAPKPLVITSTSSTALMMGMKAAELSRGFTMAIPWSM